jgi:hypothetical protein
MIAFDTFLRTLLEHAGSEAEQDRSSTIEAQHLLLAMASPSETDTRELLGSLGLDHGALRDALALELGHALGAAGVSVDSAELPGPRSAPPSVGTVPRALALAGIDRSALLGRVRRTLAADGT